MKQLRFFFSEYINKTGNSLANLVRRKRDKAHIKNIRNGTRDIVTNSISIKSLKEYYKLFYANFL
jgi:hypothetical protein